ncbi:MAG TPA: hypothetical protein VFX33_05595 [Actinomycetales bacterium]|nr:hypothetical protein [Actinomycetales bacterium]
MARRRLRLLTTLTLVGLLLAVPGFSYARAMVYPGNASWQERSVEWVREHGGNGLVNRIENWYYSRNAPKGSAPSPAALPSVPSTTGSALLAAPARPSSAAAVAAPVRLPPVPHATRLPGEGTWVAGRVGTDGRPVLYRAWFRPDLTHPSVVAGVGWIRRGTTVAHLVAGTKQPGGTGWPGGARVAPGDVARLVATFNSGFKLNDFTGGFWEAGRTGKALVKGQASLVIYRDGSAAVGDWGRDVSMTPDVVAVRQNLQLVVDRGTPVDGLNVNAFGRWGTSRNQHQYTWRSGVGTDRFGDLVYVSGDQMNLPMLAQAMSEAGVVRGMELDMHPGMTIFSSWAPLAAGRRPMPTKLLPNMRGDAARYIQPDQRDFVYLTLR